MHLLIFEMGLTIQNRGIAEFRWINVVDVFQLLVSCGENRIKTAYFARARLLVLWHRDSRDWWVGHFSFKITISKRKSTPIFLKRWYIYGIYMVTIFCLLVFVLSAVNLNLFSYRDDISLLGSHPSDSLYFVKFLNTLYNCKAVGRRPNFATVDVTAKRIFHIRSNLSI